MTRRILYYPAITLIALTLTLTVIMITSTYRNLHKGQEQMAESLALEASALLRLFEKVVHEHHGEMPNETTRFQHLAEAIAPDDDIAYVYLFSEDGRIWAHTDTTLNGTQVNGRFPQAGELLRLRNDSAKEHILEIRREFHPADSTSTGSHFAALGLRMTAVEQVHNADHRHNIMMAAILVLLGTASLFFILVVQNFYLVQRTLDRTKSYVHYVIESMANGLISLDADGIITTVNPVAADLLGISEEEARGKHIDLFLPEQSDPFQRVLYEDTSILNEEFVHRRRDGGSIPVGVSATQVKDHSRARLGAVIILHDLREVKELQGRAKRAEHLASIGRMSATVAHEIRNPLSSIRGFAQYFATMFKDEEEECEYAMAMIEEADRLNRVVSQLLDYARPLELNCSFVDIRKLFGDVVRVTHLDTETQGIRLHQEIHEDVSTIYVDRDRILQVLLNLVQNSVAAMPDGGELILRADAVDPEGRITLAVEDTGTGISEGDISQLFEPFFTTKTRGSGLGLAVVRKIMDAHDGKIHVQSEVGKGTCMVLTLPQKGYPDEEDRHADADTDRR